jgi:hypothetical protein
VDNKEIHMVKQLKESKPEVAFCFWLIATVIQLVVAGIMVVNLIVHYKK